MNPAFERYIGIDYSGAQTPTSSLKPLRVYAAGRSTAPQEVGPPPFCPRCGRGNQQADSSILTEGSPTAQEPTEPSVSPGEVGRWNHPDKE